MYGIEVTSPNGRPAPPRSSRARRTTGGRSAAGPTPLRRDDHVLRVVAEVVELGRGPAHHRLDLGLRRMLRHRRGILPPPLERRALAGVLLEGLRVAAPA